jgi:hypothetical protein
VNDDKDEVREEDKGKDMTPELADGYDVSCWMECW